MLHPDYKTSFRSFDDALQRLLPYHVYQGMLPSAQDYRKGESSRGVAHSPPGLPKREDGGLSFKKRSGGFNTEKKKPQPKKRETIYAFTLGKRKFPRQYV